MKVEIMKIGSECEEVTWMARNPLFCFFLILWIYLFLHFTFLCLFISLNSSAVLLCLLFCILDIIMFFLLW